VGKNQVFTLNSLLFGHYSSLRTPVHRLDPRVKLIWAIAVMAVLALTLDALVYVGITVYLIALIIISRLPRATILPAMKSFLLLFAITFTLHVLFAPPGGRVFLEFIGIKISSLGIQNGILYSYRIFLFLMTAALMNLTASPVEMTDGIMRLLRPLRLIRVPVNEISVMIFIALRFIPILSDEARTIRAAQLSRGLRPAKGLVDRVRSVIPLLLPLFLGAVRRAEHLALAIESRGFRRDVTRTSLSVLRVGRVDVVFAAVSIVILSGLLILSGIVTQ